MKLLVLVAFIVLANAGLLVWGQAPRVWATATADQWNRRCVYYFPVRTFDAILPLSQSCPFWATPR